MKILLIATTVLLTTAAMATEKIDIYKYDRIEIYKNISSTIAEIEIDGIKMTNDGVNPYKILEGTVLSCKELGFDKKPDKQVFPDHVYYLYTKQLKNDVEATCMENIYKNGSMSFAVLIDGSD